MKSLKEAVAETMSKFFGNDISSMILSSYEDDETEELINVAESMLTKLVGHENAKKHLEPVYSIARKRKVSAN